jgi:hypothetical protein
MRRSRRTRVPCALGRRTRLAGRHRRGDCALSAAEALQKRLSAGTPNNSAIERTLNAPFHSRNHRCCRATRPDRRDARAHTRSITIRRQRFQRGGVGRDLREPQPSSTSNPQSVWAGGLGLRWPRLEMATSPREQRRTVTGRALRSRQAQGRLSRLATWVRRFVATTHLAVLSRTGPVGSLGDEGTTTSRFRWRTRWLRPTRPPQT